MELLLAGIGMFALIGGLFWWALPRGGEPHWFIGTQWEPYLAVVMVVGVGLGIALIGSGVVGMAG